MPPLPLLPPLPAPAGQPQACWACSSHWSLASFAVAHTNASANAGLPHPGRSGSAVADEPSSPAEDYSGENLDEVLLTEVEVGGSRRYVVYRNGAVVDAAELEQLCDKVGWPRRPLNKVQAALANSFLVSALFLEAQPPASSAAGAPSSDGSSSSSSSGGAPPPGSRLIGLARCTSDGAFNATIWDVLVDPEFQGQVGGGCHAR